MDLDLIKKNVDTHVYLINANSKVPLHKHADKDEIFYCIKGTGFGVTDTDEKVMNVGDEFIAHAGTLHSLRADSEMIVVAVLVPSSL